MRAQLGDIRAFVAHTAAVVDDKSDARGDIFSVEKLDVLQTIFLKDLKIVRFQSGHVSALAVRNVENDEINIDSDRVLLSVPALWDRDGGNEQAAKPEQY